MRAIRLLLVASLLVSAPVPAAAEGRLLATGGVTEFEGQAGGGLVPWALIAGYGTKDEIGAAAFTSYARLSDFRLQSSGAAIGFFDRFELSYARVAFGLGSTVPGRSLHQDVYGAKLKVAGDAVFDQDTWLPQLAVGVQYKNNRDFDLVPRAIGARQPSGADLYVAATKLFLAGAFGRNVLVDTTLRASKANQFGLLGFGGDLDDRYHVRAEASAALFVVDALAVGGEYRGKSGALSAFAERSAQDVFVAWVPNKRVALTGAYLWLHRIANQPRQGGFYLSLQLSD